MLFKPKDKFTIDVSKIHVEVLSAMPGAQGVRFENIDNDNYYCVLVNGAKSYMTESVLKILSEKVSKKPKKEEKK